MKELNIETILWERILADLGLQAGMLVSMGAGEAPEDCAVLSAGGIPVEPFNGSENQAVVCVVRDCIEKQPLPHEHGIGDFPLARLIERHGRARELAAVATFVMVETEAGQIVFLGFPKGNARDKSRVERARDIIGALIEYVCERNKLMVFEKKLEFTEKYTREIGHDLASSMQAIYGKLSYIGTGRLNAKAMADKAREAMREAMNIVGIAESLDLTLDRDYTLQCRERIVVGDLFRRLCDEYEAEAREKGVTLDVSVEREGMFVVADRKALHNCLVHLLLNAIKYSHDNTMVQLACSMDSEDVLLVVSNVGVALPRGEEALRIWDFGYRSKYAKERHVNGSGIGLYTARKIVLAHGGRIWHDQRGNRTRFVVALRK